ncbi:hypothetical protein QYE77_14400 [Thermanaerothrix sp. 4228-RoL]|uniref:Uncharacterized protein n=1 Tax=Thermanaerothrix solaris TaxID=3058434 RepID=A0ABU3NRJ3_9CHLR|nr:hypothetical protein [Thermanaerothrix sp. 4228-RoL]MDT8899452.1 hypothetical protein [Thermanaerothrix sp. 4228-RoL]
MLDEPKPICRIALDKVFGLMLIVVVAVVVAARRSMRRRRLRTPTR